MSATLKLQSSLENFRKWEDNEKQDDLLNQFQNKRDNLIYFQDNQDSFSQKNLSQLNQNQAGLIQSQNLVQNNYQFPKRFQSFNQDKIINDSINVRQNSSILNLNQNINGKQRVLTNGSLQSLLFKLNNEKFTNNYNSLQQLKQLSKIEQQQQTQNEIKQEPEQKTIYNKIYNKSNIYLENENEQIQNKIDQVYDDYKFTKKRFNKLRDQRRVNILKRSNIEIKNKDEESIYSQSKLKDLQNFIDNPEIGVIAKKFDMIRFFFDLRISIGTRQIIYKKLLADYHPDRIIIDPNGNYQEIQRLQQLKKDYREMFQHLSSAKPMIFPNQDF